jgi:hypothetical protein
METSVEDLLYNPLAEKPEVDKYSLITELVKNVESFVPYLKATDTSLAATFKVNIPIYTYDLEKILPDQKQKLITFVIDQTQLEYPSLTFNKHMLKKFANGLNPFDANVFRDYIHSMYDDADLETVRQLQELIAKMVGSYKHRTIDDLERIYKTGIQLHSDNNEEERCKLVNAVVKFAQIVISDIPPTEVVGFDEIELGASYSTPAINRLQCYDSHNNVKIIFKTVEDRDKFIVALYREPWDVLFRPEPIVAPTEPLTFCTSCIVKDYMCDICNNHNNWVGNCKYCFSNSNIYNSHGDCEKCEIGKVEKFHTVNIKTTDELKEFLESKSKERSW